MKCFKLEETNMSTMPSPGILTKKNGLDEFKRQINRLYNKEIEKEFKDIADIIYKKLESESFDKKWTSKEYGEFKRIFLKIGLKEMKYISGSIKKCLELSNKEILDELDKFSNVTNWYPIMERKNIEGSNKYIHVNKGIDVSDCFYIINNLMLYIYRYIYRYSEKIVSISECKCNINITEEIGKKFLNDFDKEFSYIKDYPLFYDVYIRMREDAINILSNHIVNIVRITTRRDSKMVNYTGSAIYSKRTTNLRKYSKSYTKGV